MHPALSLLPYLPPVWVDHTEGASGNFSKVLRAGKNPTHPTDTFSSMLKGTVTLLLLCLPQLLSLLSSGNFRATPACSRQVEWRLSSVGSSDEVAVMGEGIPLLTPAGGLGRMGEPTTPATGWGNPPLHCCHCRYSHLSLAPTVWKQGEEGAAAPVQPLWIGPWLQK